MDQTSACKAARDALAAGGEGTLHGGRPPQWMVLDIAATGVKQSLQIGLTTVGLDKSVETSALGTAMSNCVPATSSQ
ncbi:MAG TPA: hypothetical protein VIS09_04590 [Streptomyces sp.]